jgi:hypothetical protein
LWLVWAGAARVERDIVMHPEYHLVAEQMFESIYRHLQYAHDMEKTRVRAFFLQIDIMLFLSPISVVFIYLFTFLQGTLITWAEVLELHAERLEKANGDGGGEDNPRVAELRALAVQKRALALEAPRHHCDSDDEACRDDFCI